MDASGGDSHNGPAIVARIVSPVTMKTVIVPALAFVVLISDILHAGGGDGRGSSNQSVQTVVRFDPTATSFDELM